MKFKDLIGKEFIRGLDSNLKTFCREVKKDLRDENDGVVGITGYPGVGKSQTAAIISLLIDDNYSLEKNICFIPTSKQIEETYLNLPMYSCFHIDEASRGLHKHKWHDRVQQKLNLLYDTDREGHFLCTLLLMPRFQNFAENFRNFRIRYWVNIPQRGIAIFYRRDEDKDTKDPWNLDENYKKKIKYWRGKKLVEREIGDVIRAEQKTKNYWFYVEVPEIPKEIWQKYKDLKAQSRVDAKENEASLEVENYRDKLTREKMARWQKIVEMKNKGHTNTEIAVVLEVTSKTITSNLREIEAWNRMKGEGNANLTLNNNNIYNQISNVKSKKIPVEFNEI